MTVAGVLPATFRGPFNAAWDCLIPDEVATPSADRDAFEVYPIARLRQDVTVNDAQVEMENVSARIRRRTGREPTDGVVVMSLSEREVGYQRPGLLLVLGAVLLVLSIAIANASGLVAARSLERRREFALRASLGASGRRIVQQVLAETAVLVALAAAAGLLVAVTGLAVAWPLAPGSYTRVARGFEINGALLLFALAVTAGSTLACGLAPALATTERQTGALKSGGERVAPAPWKRWRYGLGVLEIALSLTLLVGAALLVRDLGARWPHDPGFETVNRLTLKLRLDDSRYRTDGDRRSFVDRVRSRLSLLPGVRSVSTANIVPFDGFAYRLAAQRADAASDSEAETTPVELRTVSADHLQQMGIPIVEGRPLEPSDDAGTEPVAVISRTLRQRLFDDTPALGQPMRILDPYTDGVDAERYQEVTVVGVAGDVHNSTVSTSPTPPVYRPYAQAPLPSVTFVLATYLPPARLVDAAQNAIWRLDPDQLISRVATANQLVSSRFAEPRFFVLVFGAFAMIGVVIAGSGLYGTLSYTVVARFRELGIRVALGARSRHVLALVMREGAAICIGGFAAGLLGAWVLSKIVLNTMLIRISPLDPVAYLFAALALAALGSIAMGIPARRATKVDPLTSLRLE